MRRLCLMLCFVVPSVCCAQKEATHWYFGVGAGLSFANGSPQALLDGAMNAFEGCATISDRSTGGLLFYTDGITVWNRNHDMMTNGFDLAGHESSTQSALIVPYPGSDDLYYIFTTYVVSSLARDLPLLGFNYSVVDMNESSGLGAVIQKNVLLLDSTAEKQAATFHCNGEEYWVVTHHATRNEFYAFHVTSAGIDPNPVISIVGEEPRGEHSYAIGYLKISPNGKMIAVAAGNHDLFRAQQLFDFDNATGRVSNGRTIENNLSSYGATFSPDNTKLYLVVDFGAALYQYDVTAPDATSIRNSETEIAALSGFAGALQIGPDGKIYLSEFQQPLSVINKPNAKGLACDFRAGAQALGGRRGASGLPNFIDAWFNEGKDGRDCTSPISAFEADTMLCRGDSLRIHDISERCPHSWLWTFAGGLPDRFEGPAPPPVWYPAPGVYTVALETINPFGSHRDSLTVTVLPRPDVEAGPDIAICRGEQTTLEARGAESYQWTPAASLSDAAIADPIATPEETTQYIVATINEFGCIDRDTVIVQVDEPALAQVSGDTETCAGQAIRLRASGGAQYRWTPSTYLDDPQSPNPLLTPPANADDQTIVYTVRVSNGVCASTASLSVRIRALPPADAGPDTATCVGQTLRLRASGGDTYRWTPSTFLDDPQTPNPLLTPPPDAGDQTIIYTVQVWNAECVATTSLSVQVHALPTVDAGPDTTICPGAPTQLSGSGNGTYRWTPIDGLDDPTSPTPIAAPTETTVYRLTVTGAGGCTAFDETTVTVESALDLSVRTPEPICAGDSVQLFAEGAGAYRWEPAQFFRDPTEQNPWVAPLENQIFTVHGSGGACHGSTTVTIVVLPAPNGAAGPDTMICAGSVARLWASGGESYVWTPAGGLSDSRSAQPEARPVQTTEYTVTITDANGCSTTASALVEILPHVAFTLEVERQEDAALPNELRSISILIRATPAALAQAAIDSVFLTLAYDAFGLGYEDTGIEPGVAAPNWHWQAQERPDEGLLHIRGSGPPVVTAGTLCAAPLRVFLSGHRDVFSKIEITEAQMRGSNACFAMATTSGGITLSPFCLSDNRPIVLTDYAYSLSAPRPNPASEMVEIHYSVGFAGHTGITVYSALGERVRTVVDAYKSAGEYSATIDGLPSGSYYCVMESGPYRATRPLFILR